MHRVWGGLATTARGLLLCGSLAAAGAALAAPLTVQEYQCRRDGQIRSVSLRLDDAVQPVTCDVRYRKLTELLNHDEILWRATSGLRFCRERAEILQAKLERWGWRCGPHEPDGSSSASAPATTPLEALTPSVVTVMREQASALRASLVAGYGKSAVLAPTSLVVHGDLDGDGDSDAVAGFVTLPRQGGVRAVISVFRNEGDEHFKHVVSRGLSANRWPGHLEIKDGRIFLATTEHGAKRSIVKNDVYSLHNGRLMHLSLD